MDRTLRLEKESIGKLLYQFSLPAIIGMMVMASYNIVDRIFVGRGVGALAISGIAITFPAIIIFMAFGMLVGIGATAILSIRLGEKKIQEAEQTLGNALTLSVVIGIILTAIFYIFLDPLLILFGGTGEVLEYARDFSKVMLIGGVFQMISFTMNNLIRGEGNPKMAMTTMIIGAVLNTILNPIFIFGLNWGIQGSAWATVISQGISSAWVLLYFFGKKSHVHFHFANLKLRKNIVSKIFSIGVSPFIMQIAASIVIMIFNKSLAHYGGDLAVASMAITNAITMFIVMPIFGINQGIQPILGYNFGAKLYHRVRRVFELGILAATVICVLGFVTVIFFSGDIVRFFERGNEELLYIGSRALRIYLFMLPVVGYQIISAAYFQAVGKPKFSLILTVARQVGILIPAILILPDFFGLDGVWAAGPVSDLLSGILSAVFLIREMKILKKLELEMKEVRPEPKITPASF
ncbi:MAG: MATE family efflux transporter [Ignavibacteriae bacterium]|nr:MATE family efflux transporter [Ignavibacteriota bacterium]